MIKPEELRINSWYVSTKWQVAVKCEMSDIVEIYHRADGATPDENHIASVFQPIPLSPEWLERLGFIHDEGFFDLDEMSIDFKSNRIYWKNWYIRKIPKHVHNLQNLYRELKGKELELKQ